MQKRTSPFLSQAARTESWVSLIPRRAMPGVCCPFGLSQFTTGFKSFEGRTKTALLVELRIYPHCHSRARSLCSTGQPPALWNAVQSSLPLGGHSCALTEGPLCFGRVFLYPPALLSDCSVLYHAAGCVMNALCTLSWGRDSFSAFCPAHSCQLTATVCT